MAEEAYRKYAEVVGLAQVVAKSLPSMAVDCVKLVVLFGVDIEETIKYYEVRRDWKTAFQVAKEVAEVNVAAGYVTALCYQRGMGVTPISFARAEYLLRYWQKSDRRMATMLAEQLHHHHTRGKRQESLDIWRSEPPTYVRSTYNYSPQGEPNICKCKGRSLPRTPMQGQAHFPSPHADSYSASLGPFLFMKTTTTRESFEHLFRVPSQWFDDYMEYEPCEIELKRTRAAHHEIAQLACNALDPRALLWMGIWVRNGYFRSSFEHLSNPLPTKCLEHAADQGCAWSQHLLGMQVHDSGPYRLYWLSAAASQGYAPSLIALERAYTTGDISGICVSSTQATYWTAQRQHFESVENSLLSSLTFNK